MQLYKNLESKSSVLQYKIGSEFVIVQFKNRSTIEFTYDKAGKERVETIKQLASKGTGLQRFVLKKSNLKYGKVISK